MEILVSISSLIVAICALGFTAWQTSVQRYHNRISVKPHLCSFIERDKNDNVACLKVLLINNGLGPAYINKFQPYFKGQECKLDRAISNVLGEMAKNSSHTALGDDYAMSANERKVLLSVTFLVEADGDIDKVEDKLNALDLVVDYSSAYGELGTYDSRENTSSV